MNYFLKKTGIALPALPGNNPVNQLPQNIHTKAGLSDNAFYLVVLASLLRETIKPGTLPGFLATKKFSGNDRSTYLQKKIPDLNMN